MHIAYLCADPGIPVFGTKGASVHIQELVRAWRRRGDDVTVYCTRRGNDVPDDLADLRVVCEPVGSSSDVAGREREQAAAAHRLAQAALADGVDVVHERYSLFSTALAEITSAVGVPGLLEVNAPLIDEQRTHRELVDRAGAEAALEQQLLSARRVACVSQEVANWLEETNPAAADIADIVVTPNGVNPERFAAAAATDPSVDPVTVVFVGTLKPWHGVEHLLEAATRAGGNWRLRVIGDGPMGPALRAQAEADGLDVDFRGSLAPADVPGALADCLISVAPYPATTDHYFSPLKVYEAAAAGLATVASAVGQIPSIIDDGVSGVLVPPSDTEALAAAIDDLAKDPDRARAMGLAARDEVCRSHTWDQVLASGIEGMLK